MIYSEAETFTEVYLNLLKDLLACNLQVSSSSKGKVYDAGHAVFCISGDRFRMPLLLHRGFNPFFAIIESVWVLLGSNSLAPLQKYIRNYEKYTDDGITLNGAYGYRLRNFFNIDQIEKTIELLKKEKKTRQVVLQLWSHEDLGKVSNDIPCNTQVMFKIVKEKLNITVINRSNDIFKGVPYNVFIFYILQEYIAKRIGIKIGKQIHFTDSLHLYLEDYSNVVKIIENNKNINFEKMNEFLKYYQWSFFSDENLMKQFLEKEAKDITCLKEFQLFDIKGKNVLDVKKFFNEKTPLVLASLLWHNAFGRCNEIEEVYRMLFMSYDSSFFEQYKYLNTDEIEKNALLFAAANKVYINKIHDFILLNKIYFKGDDESLLQSLFLASVISTLSASIMYPAEYDERVECFKKSADIMNLDYDFIIKLTPYVEKMYLVL